MGKYDKLFEHILLRRSDANVPFSEFCHLMTQLGFTERINGDHHIFTMPGIEEILNFQPKGSKAKVYQVRQARNVILKYGLTLEDSDG